MRARALAVGLALLAGGAWPIAAAPGTACASSGDPTAALVVDNGKRVLAMCVTLDSSSVTGLHLIELASAQHGLSYGFGLGGQAVCRLDGVGPAGDDCFAEYPEYWGYWHGDSKGAWTWASTGAAGYQVADGDIEGWVWGKGDTGQSHDAPPATGHDDVCAQVEQEPSPEPSPQQSPKPPPPSPEPSSGLKPTSAPSSDAGTRSPSPENDGPSSSTSHTRSPRVQPDEPATSSPGRSQGPAAGAAGAGGGASPGGPSPGLILAAGLALLLAAGGWGRLRSRGGADMEGTR